MSVKITGRFKCPRCGGVHNGIPKAHAIAAVEDFNSYLATLTEVERKEWYGGKTASLASYQRCFFCGNPSENFVTVERSVRHAATNQPIVAPTRRRRGLNLSSL